MWSVVVVRKIALVAAGAALVGSGALTACSQQEKPTETKAPSSSTAPSPSPTEKINVGSFTPTVKAPPAPTALPGNVITGNH